MRLSGISNMTPAQEKFGNLERHVFLDAPLIILSSFVCAEFLIPNLSSDYASWPFVVSLFVVGMPHGAIDWSITRQLRGTTANPPRSATFMWYLLAMTATTLLLILTPISALLIFLVISGLHFGQADARDLEIRFDERTPQRLWHLPAIVRGLLLMALPFCFSAPESLVVFSDILRLLGKTAVPVEAGAVSSWAALIVAVGIVGHVVVTMIRLKHAQWKSAGFELVETSVIFLAFWVLHPLFAMGLYLVAWHSWRHLHVLARFFRLTRTPEERKNWVHAVFRLHLEAVPLMVPTIAIVATVAYWRLEVWSADAFAALVIATYVVVTLPHYILVERLATESKHTRSIDHTPSLNQSRASVNLGNKSIMSPGSTKRHLQEV